MKFINKIFVLLAVLVVALMVPMLQVRADDSLFDEYWYEVTQKYYENGELKTDITYHFTFSHEVFYYRNPLGDHDNLILSYWTGEGIMPVIIGQNSYKQSNLSPYERTDYSGVRNPSVNLMDGSYTFQGKSYLYVNNLGGIKLFSSRAAAMAYFEDGDDSGWENKLVYDPDNLHFSSALGYLQKVQYKNVTPTDTFPYQIYSQISWDNSNNNWDDAYIQIAADVTYKVGFKTFSESMVIFKDYGSVKYIDGKYTFLMSEVSGGLSALEATVKRVDFYYVRLIKYDKESSSFLYGGWTRIDTNKFTIDTIAYDEENQDYYIDFDSDSSYSDQMGIDGNYGTLNWGDLSSASADSFKWFFSMLKDLFGMMGAFPSMLKTVFSFLPTPYINCLSLLLIACVIMRILGR